MELAGGELQGWIVLLKAQPKVSAGGRFVIIVALASSRPSESRRWQEPGQGQG